MFTFISIIILVISQEFPKSVFAQIQSETNKNRGYTQLERLQKKSLAKYSKLKRFLSTIDTKPPVTRSNGKLEPDLNGAQHNVKGPAIFAVSLMQQKELPYYPKSFVSTARKAGFNGDIVLAFSTGMSDGFMEIVHKGKCVVYTIDLTCNGDTSTGHPLCTYQGSTSPAEAVPINMIRFQLYQYWASLYDESAIIMISDFRDVLFQKNPFTYMADRWGPPVSQLAVFLESYPTKIIERCSFNSNWIKHCYGDLALKTIGLNPVSCSGVSIGSRDGILLYAYLINRQLDPVERWGSGSGKDNSNCISTGMDQGFHNWLVFSGVLERYIDITIFNQGEGPVNTLGALKPTKESLYHYNLTEWKVMKGQGDQKYIYNWNGDISPVVHQYDRFDAADFEPHISKHLAILNGMF